MCIDCGCAGRHDHNHDHDQEGRTVRIEENLLAKNDRLAERNRELFDAKQMFVLNLVSSPGSGKTSILERTLADLKERHGFAVL
nr:hydrogenase nickel incorporation protein HypB [Desulfuromonadales bacterium]